MQTNTTATKEGTFQPLNEEQVQKFAKWRNYSPEIVHDLSDRGVVVTDGTNVAFATTGGFQYRYKNGKDSKASWAYTKGAKPSTFVVGEVSTTVSIHESPFDAISYHDATGEAAIATRGASNARLACDFIKEHSIKSAVIVPQNDEAGTKWLDAVMAGVNGSCELKVMRVPAEFKDLNDWRKAGATEGDVLNAYMDAKPPGQPATQSKNLRRLNTFTMAPIVFIDKPLFQANAFHLLAGKKNSGKGVFLTSVAARVTRGELGSKREVLWVSAGEDSISLDVYPRMEAAKANSALVHCPEIVLKLPQGIGQIREWLSENPGIGLVVLDPISGMLQPGTNSNNDTEVRETIAPLNNVADDFKVLIVGVRHLKKNVTDGALASVLGSTDWVNVPRAVLAIADDNEDKDVRTVQVVAGNRLPKGTASRSFRITGAEIVPGGEPVALAIPVEGCGKNVDELLAAPPIDGKKRRAKIAMLDLLEEADEALESDKLTEGVMAASGVGLHTAQDAKTELKKIGLIVFVPDKDENGKLRKWRIKRSGVKRPDSLIDKGS
jgi:hypothetical protein